MAVKRAEDRPDLRAGRSITPAPTTTPVPTQPASTAAESIAAAARRRRPHLPPYPAPTKRVTVDLPTEDHRGLSRAADEIADILDISTVPIAHVMAALAHLVTEENDALRRRVAEHLSPRITTDDTSSTTR